MKSYNHNTNKIRKPAIALSLLMLAGLIIAPITWAELPAGFTQPPPSKPNPNTIAISQLGSSLAAIPQSISSGMSAGFSKLQAFLEKKYREGKTWVISQDYQKNPNASTIQQLYTMPTPLSKLTASAAQTATQNNIDNSLNQFMYKMNPKAKISIAGSPNEPFSNYMINNSTRTLLKNSPANDTLYVSEKNLRGKQSTYYVTHQKQLRKPIKKYNNYFNFSSLITPTSYNPQQEEAAKSFVKFATKDTQDLLSGVKGLDKLKTNAKALHYLKDSSTRYQNYKFNMRSLLAIRSLETNVLNGLIAERTPVSNLAKTTGLPCTGQYCSASPLKIEAYRADHRLQSNCTKNPKCWYNSIQNVSPATMQRKMLIVLAEIEHQNYQAHLDRERLLAALAMLNIQTNMQLTQTAQLLENQELEKAIKKALVKYPPNK